MEGISSKWFDGGSDEPANDEPLSMPLFILTCILYTLFFSIQMFSANSLNGTWVGKKRDQMPYAEFIFGTAQERKQWERYRDEEVWFRAYADDDTEDKVFDGMDANQDGVVDRDEFHAAVSAHNVTLREGLPRMGESEMETGARSRYQGLKRQRDEIIKTYFRRYDLNNSGLIDTSEELQQLCINLAMRLRDDFAAQDAPRLVNPTSIDNAIHELNIEQNALTLAEFIVWWETNMEWEQPEGWNLTSD